MLHHAAYGKLKSLVLLYEGGHLFRGLAVLIMQQVERGFLGLVLRVGQKDESYLIEDYQRGALGGKADDKREHCYDDYDERSCEVLPFFYRVDRLNSYVVSRCAGGRQQQQDRHEARKQLEDKRNSKNDRCNDKPDYDCRVKWAYLPCGGRSRFIKMIRF